MRRNKPEPQRERDRGGEENSKTKRGVGALNLQQESPKAAPAKCMNTSCLKVAGVHDTEIEEKKEKTFFSNKHTGSPSVHPLSYPSSAQWYLRGLLGPEITKCKDLEQCLIDLNAYFWTVGRHRDNMQAPTEIVEIGI